MKSADVIRRLRREGRRVLHHVRGSHHPLKHPRKPGKVTVLRSRHEPPGGHPA